MQLGMIGLGKMGGNMKLRLERDGHRVVGYDRDPDKSDVGSPAELVEALEAPRAVWVMVPAGAPTRSTVSELAGLLSAGDLVADGGNSRFSDDETNAALLAEHGVGYVDVGVSGGVWGFSEGYALMVGGPAADVRRLGPVFETLKPEGDFGYVHAGGVGAGHYAKMVHNGIEYAMMAAYAEGYELLEASEHVDNVPEVVKSWRSGTVIRSWLLDLLDRALDDDPELAEIRGWVEDSGEGRWTVEEAVRLRVPLPVIADSLFARFASRQDDSPAMKAIAALRNQFGGHAVKPE
ncbi:phosphogluconate dehydrogenase (NAD(+)-dependent, decarboxylating) [Glycomyces xiaoerkulensis]|uniref:phosphogluconate dehydrogenase (NAD(+)-dependent, decarboxylating) n=1 Tax=Glycomyces xiaoerkulensis TaxID=2038139 RepID=UPI000C265589|nr:decarboxylating 6-phosphogluconate dehydrogenase [Glycomyces xiaoerkulensis]